MVEMAEARMSCDDLEPFLHAYLDGEFDIPERTEVERHLASCSRCASRLASEATWLRAMRDHVQRCGRSPAPEALRHRVLEAVNGEHRRSVARRWGQLSAAAAVVCVVGAAGVWEHRSLLRKRYQEDAAARHAMRYPLELQQQSAEQIEAWFGGKLPHRVLVPRFANAQPIGARLLNVAEKQAAYISYNAPLGSRARQIGLFVYDDQRGDTAFTPLAEADVGTSHGFNVVSWRDGDIVYQLVSDLDERDILELVRSRGPNSTEGRPGPRRLEVQPASLQR